MQSENLARRRQSESETSKKSEFPQITSFIIKRITIKTLSKSFFINILDRNIS